jgi:hypothetical protein
MRTSTRAVLGAAAAAALSLVPALSAHADPANAKNSLPLTVTCADGSTYQTVTNGNGAWTPAHDLGSTSTLVPVSFGTVTFTVYDAQGNIVDQETTPPRAKGAIGNNSHATLACDFSGSQTAPDGSRFTIVGSVVGFVTPNGG